MKNCNKDNKGIILIIVLWVLFFLSIVVLTLGFKNRINIRLRSLNNEELKVFYLAKEGVNRAIGKLAADDYHFDSFADDWSKELTLENDQGFLSIQIIDEDRFLNINTASYELLKNARVFFENLSKEDIKVIYEMRPFNISGELKDIKKIDEGKFEIITSDGIVKSYDLLTTFSDGKLNINTAPEEVLLVIPGMSRVIVESIIDRRGNSPFENNDTLLEELSGLGLTPGQISSLSKMTKVNSSVFRISVNAVSLQRSVSKTLEVVVKREEEGFKILYAMEN